MTSPLPVRIASHRASKMKNQSAENARFMDLLQYMHCEISCDPNACEWVVGCIVDKPILLSNELLLAFCNIGLNESSLGIQYEKTLLGDLIRWSCCPTEQTGPNRKRKTTDPFFKKLHSLLARCLADAKTCGVLLDWFEGAILANRRLGDDLSTRKDYAGHEFMFGLADLIICLCLDALRQSGNLHLKYPVAMQLYQYGSEQKVSFLRTSQHCRAAGFPDHMIQARAIQLFHLAHRVFELTYNDSWVEFELLIESNVPPVHNPWLSSTLDTTVLLSFSAATADWLNCVSQLNRLPHWMQLPRWLPGAEITVSVVPNMVYSNLSTYCKYVREFGDSPERYDHRQLLRIVETMVVLVGNTNCGWHMRVELLEGLMLLVPRTVDLQPISTDWYPILDQLPALDMAKFRWLLVPTLLRLSEDVERLNYADPQDSDHKVPIYEMLTHLFSIPEQKQQIRRLSMPNGLCSPWLVDLRRFLFGVLDGAKMLMDVMYEAKRSSIARRLAEDLAAAAAATTTADGAVPQADGRAAATVQAANNPVARVPEAPEAQEAPEHASDAATTSRMWYLHTDLDYELDPTEFGKYTVHKLMCTHLRLLCQFIVATPEMCYESAIAQQLATLMNGLLHEWLSTEDDRMRVRMSTRLGGTLHLLAYMLHGMSLCEEFIEWLAQEGDILDLWRLGDMFGAWANHLLRYTQTKYKRGECTNAKLMSDCEKVFLYGQLRKRLVFLERQVLREKRVLGAMAKQEDAPSDFLDAITSRVMRDPVQLPASNMRMDMPTIQRMLATQRSDPFTRTDLRMGQLIPDLGLRIRIEEWREKARKEPEFQFDQELAGLLEWRPLCRLWPVEKAKCDSQIKRIDGFLLLCSLSYTDRVYY